jgi:hypothetical protein
MNIISALSVDVAKQVYKIIKDMGHGLDHVHFQAIENKIESPEGDNIYIQRVLDDTGDDKQELNSSSTPGGQLFAKQYQLYKQDAPKTSRLNRFVYCIVPPNNMDDVVRTVCVILLSQSRVQGESGMTSDYEYEALRYYIAIPLRARKDQQEQSSDIKDAVLRMANDWDEFRECVKADSFTTGRLWEVPIQLPGYSPMYLTMHEPIARPSILNVVLQKYSGVSVSKKTCADLILD